ncbi:MAG: DNA cytosine methyltransferase [Longicatena sp.]
MEDICDQIGMFQMLYSDFKFTKEVREIETFAGYGSQRMSLKRLNDEGRLKSKSWKTVEWEYHAIRSYYEVHCADDKTDYAKDMTYDELLAYFKDSGISADGKKPMTLKQIIRKGEKWMREIYNKIKATKNLVDITKVHSKDLEIVDKDKYQYILTYSFPCQDLSKAGKQQGMAKGSGTRSGMLS